MTQTASVIFYHPEDVFTHVAPSNRGNELHVRWESRDVTVSAGFLASPLEIIELLEGTLAEIRRVAGAKLP
jgi:hypothetical protein